jgi:F-type H+-transporting ATPase subunit b
MTPLTAALLAAAEGGGGSLTDFDTTLYWATLAMFALFAFVLGKFAWGPLLGIIEDREKSIREAVEGSEKANTEAKELLEKHRAMLRDATAEREEIINRAVDEAEKVKADITQTARAEGEKLVSRAREQIERDKAAAILELRSQVTDIAIEAASKIVTSSLTPEVQRKLVDDFVDELPRRSS